MHRPVAPDSHFDDVILGLAFVAQNLVDLVCRNGPGLRNVAREASSRVGRFGPDLLDRIPHVLDGLGQLLWVALSSDVHEVDLRLIEKEMVVQAGYLQPAGQSSVHGGRDFILTYHGVSHDYRSMLGPSECRPGAKPGEWLERHAVDLHGDICPSPGDAGYATRRDRGFRASGLADRAFVQL